MNFKDDDKLQREKYADFLIEIISNSNEYKRQSDTSSFVIAIDSSWGTGKTTFLNMLESKMNSIGNNNYTIIRNNAWKSDVWKNPFETLMYTILENDIFNIQDEVENFKEIGSSLKECALEVAKGFFKKQASKIITDEAFEIIDDKVFKSGKYQDTLKNQSSNYNFFEDYDLYQKSIVAMKEKLQKICNKRKMIIFIDELDRCRPNFSVELLEVVKHLFDVKNLVFLFTLDINQLSYSVQSIYGNGIDAAGYLCRFFDYISKLPKPNTDFYIDYLLDDKKLLNDSLVYSVNKNGTVINTSFKDTFKDLANLYGLSLRDINTIYSNFLIFEKMELAEVSNIKAYHLYLFLIIMKYKDTDCFNKIFIQKENTLDCEFIQNIKKLNTKIYSYSSIASILRNDSIISDIYVAVSISKYKILNIDTKKMEIIYSIPDEYPYSFSRPLTSDTSCEDVLFFNDILNWDNIKNLHITDYIHRKLEMFDFSWNDKLENNE